MTAAEQIRKALDGTTDANVRVLAVPLLTLCTEAAAKGNEVARSLARVAADARPDLRPAVTMDVPRTHLEAVLGAVA